MSGLIRQRDQNCPCRIGGVQRYADKNAASKARKMTPPEGEVINVATNAENP